MKKTIAAFIAITALSAQAAQGKDFQKLNDLFRKAEIDGPTLVKCGREGDQKRMYASISFLEDAYGKLDEPPRVLRRLQLLRE